MLDQIRNVHVQRRCLTLAAALLLGPLAFGQGTSSSAPAPSDSEGPVLPRIWVGLYGSATPFKQVSTKTVSNSTTGETFSTTPANGIAGAGLSVNARIAGQFWLNFGLTYRFAGYDLTDATNDSDYNVYVYRTRARYYDLPLLVRYSGPKYRWSKYSFYELGGAWRHATEKTTTASANDSGYTCCAPAITAPFYSNTEGVVVGTGLIGRDPFGIIVSPEVRYTRWMGNTFHSSTVASQRDQLEITVSFGF